MIILRTGITAETYALSQKEFGVVSNAVNKLRRNLAKQLSKSIEKDINLWSNSKHISETGGIVKVPGSRKTRDNIYKTANSSDARISRLDLREDPREVQSLIVMPNNSANALANADDIGIRNKPRRVKKLRISTEKGRRSNQIIILPKNKNIDLVAHEIGHVSNSTSNNPLVRKIHQKAKDIASESSRRVSMMNSLMGTHRRSGIKNVIRDILDEESLIAEEARASRKGLKLLRKSGATKEELKNAKKNYELGLNTYKGKGRANWKETLRNTIQPDDWKGGSFRDDL